MRLGGEHTVRTVAALGAATSLVFVIGFYAGVASVRRSPAPIVVQRIPNIETNSTPQLPKTQEEDDEEGNERVVASVHSNKYHYLSCPGASQINEENKIFFESAAAAQAAGLTLAGNCTK